MGLKVPLYRRIEALMVGAVFGVVAFMISCLLGLPLLLIAICLFGVPR